MDDLVVRMDDLANTLVKSVEDASNLGESFKLAFFKLLFTQNPEPISIFKIMASFFPKKEVDKIPDNLYDVVLAKAFLQALPENERDNFKFVVENTFTGKIIDDLYNRQIRELRKQLEEVVSQIEETSDCNPSN